MPTLGRRLNGVFAYRRLLVPIARPSVRRRTFHSETAELEQAAGIHFRDASVQAGGDLEVGEIHVGIHPIGIPVVVADPFHARHPRHHREAGHTNKLEPARP